MGGKEKLLAVKDLSSKANMKITAPQGSLEATSDESVLYPDKYRLVLTLGPMGQIVQATDGAAAYLIQGPNTRDLPPQMAAEMKNGGEQRDPLLAAATIIASQLSTLVGPPSARTRAEAAG